MKAPLPALARSVLAAAIGIIASGAAHAQDSRVVREPALPPACAVLTAEQAAPRIGQNDAPRIQAALDKCPKGQSVHLAGTNEKLAFVAGPLKLPSGVTLAIDAGVTLYASTNPRLYDRGIGGVAGTCGTLDNNGKGCVPFISVDKTRNSGIMGPGAIDGQGGQKVDGLAETWWQMARRAQAEKNRQNNPRLIEILGSEEFTMYKVALRNSPNFHVTLSKVDGFTAWGVRIDTPHDARNTDGIDPISSRNVTIAHSYIRTGDDNVAIKAGNAGPTENISIIDSHFYTGHGMSIGSETNGGMRRVLVDGLSLDGTTSGLRIKSDSSRGGEVSQVSYRNVCMRDIKRPIDIDTHYDKDAEGKQIPVYTGIAMERVHATSPGKVVLQGFDEARPLQLALTDVVVDGPPDVKMSFTRLMPVGGTPSRLNPPGSAGIDCKDRFPDFPLDAAPNPRPQLTKEQAKAYDYREVLKYTGTVGAERVDPWDPLADPLASGAVFKPDYIVDAAARADGVTSFSSVQAAVNKAVSDHARSRRAYILVKPGVYRELVYVPATAAPITLYGDGPDAAATRISANIDAAVTGESYAKQFGAQFAATDKSITEMYDWARVRPAIGTFGAAVVWVRGDGFQARNLTIENAFNKDVGNARAECVSASCSDAAVKTVAHQAVALRLEGGDKAQFENVRLLGFQDTLFLHSVDHNTTARSFFNKSYIEGDVDFIFGDTIAYFNDCEVKSLGDRPVSYAGAPDTSRHARYGFVFNGCRFTNDGSASARAGQFYFARQWFHNERCTPYGVMAVAGYSCKVGEVDVLNSPNGTIMKRTLESVGKMVVMNSRIGMHINRSHPWADWNNSGKISYRPAQYSADDWWKNLLAAGLDPQRELGEAARPASAAIYLAEYNNSYESTVAVAAAPAAPAAP
ncbi:MAG: pectinesterase family protein [Massilia sp.]